MQARLIPKEELSAYQRWELGSLSEPHTPPKSIDATTQARLDEAERDAEQKAHRSGYSAGYAEGRSAAASELERLQALLNATQLAVAEVEQGFASDVLDLAIDLARQVIRAELFARREALLPVVREALACLHETAVNPKLLLHPSDVELVRAHLGEELRVGNWQIMEDHLIEPGGCRVNSVHGDTDATLATRWKCVLASLGRSHAWHVE